MTTRSRLDILTSPAANLPVAERLRMFRESRIVAAAFALALFPLMAAVSTEPAAITAALLLLGLLPAVLAMDGLRAARLDRVAILHVLINGAILTAGVLRGLPAGPAILLMCLVAMESFLISRHRSRLIASGLSAGAIAVLVFAASLAVPDPLGHVASSFAMAAMAMASSGMLIRALATMYLAERRIARQDRMMSQEVEALVSETVLSLDEAGHVARVSANAFRVLGLPPAALLGRGLTDLTLVADRPALLNAIATTGPGAPRKVLRFRLRQDAGDGVPRFRWVQMAVETVLRSGVIMASIKDVSAEVAEEERLKRAAEEAEVARLARSSFLSTVNHELRTPLNAIIGFSDILANPATTPQDRDRVQEYARIVNGAGQDLLRMVSAMIDITRIDSGLYEFEAEEMDLIAVVEAAVDAFREDGGGTSGPFTIAAPVQPVTARIDGRALRSVLTQLLSNAAKFGQGKGVTVTFDQTNDWIKVSVADRGSGIAADKLGLLDRHFARLDETLTRDQGGIGLGLSLARGLMRLHRGHLTISSEVDKGTTVTLHLPRHEAAADPATNVLPLAEVRRAKSERMDTTRRTERKRA